MGFTAFSGFLHGISVLYGCFIPSVSWVKKIKPRVCSGNWFYSFEGAKGL